MDANPLSESGEEMRDWYSGAVIAFRVIQRMQDVLSLCVLPA